MAYATPEDLEAYLGVPGPADSARLLDRAGDLIESKMLHIPPVDDQGIPTNATVAEALNKAVCAQVEWWIEIGDEVGLTSATDGVSLGRLSISRIDSRLAPRARDKLLRAGLLSRAVGSGPRTSVVGNLPEQD